MMAFMRNHGHAFIYPEGVARLLVQTQGLKRMFDRAGWPPQIHLCRLCRLCLLCPARACAQGVQLETQEDYPLRIT